VSTQEQETAMYDQQNNDERNELFDDYLDETTPPIIIAGQTFVASNVLYECNPIAYRSYLADWKSQGEPE
jgi:hypothetical protein